MATWTSAEPSHLQGPEEPPRDSPSPSPPTWGSSLGSFFLPTPDPVKPQQSTVPDLGSWVPGLILAYLEGKGGPSDLWPTRQVFTQNPTRLWVHLLPRGPALDLLVTPLGLQGRSLLLLRGSGCLSCRLDLVSTGLTALILKAQGYNSSQNRPRSELTKAESRAGRPVFILVPAAVGCRWGQGRSSLSPSPCTPALG